MSRVCVSVCIRNGVTDISLLTDRDTDRQTDRQTDIHTHTHTHTDRQTHTHGWKWYLSKIKDFWPGKNQFASSSWFFHAHTYPFKIISSIFVTSDCPNIISARIQKLNHILKTQMPISSLKKAYTYNFWIQNISTTFWNITLSFKAYNYIFMTVPDRRLIFKMGKLTKKKGTTWLDLTWQEQCLKLKLKSDILNRKHVLRALFVDSSKMWNEVW